MWLDVVTKSSSDEEIKRHREVLTTRNNKSKLKLFIQRWSKITFRYM